ncbi:MAG: CocE/NonD family hydrolase [Promethearchaeota archaeon]
MANEDYKTLGNYGQFRKPEYKDYKKYSQYITMRDGVRIAADVLLPIEHDGKTRLPTLLYQTRYWRAVEPKKIVNKLMQHADDQGGAIPKFLVKHGYAMVMIDVRGTGASSGFRKSELASEELIDTKDILDWIVEQSWSNGKVAAFGNSYAGSTSELSVIARHSALKVVCPRANEWDIYTDILCPGGIPNFKFIQKWSEMNKYLDSNKTKKFGILGILFHGVLPVSDDVERIQLQEAVKEHDQSFDLIKALENLIFKDDPMNSQGDTIEQSSPFFYQDLYKKTKLPIQSWGSWMDACTADVVIRRFLTVDTTHIAIIGSWNHTGRFNGDPFDGVKFNKKKPSKALSYQQQMLEWIRAFDYYTKDMKSSGWKEERRLFYITMGENKWKSTQSWPPKGTELKTYYLTECNNLTQDRPTHKSGQDLYKVNFSASTGTSSRWQTQLGTPVYYKDRSKADLKLLTYTSKPLKESLEMTGYPIVHLKMSIDNDDGAVFVYLEIISPENKVIYLTEGQLRLMHRKICPSTEAPYVVPYPYHSFLRKDKLEVVPGEKMEVVFHLLPISVRIPKNYRIRIAIAGHDNNNFSRIPKQGKPTFTIFRGENSLSYIELPIMKSKE